jgi:NAD(P)-dependent dehydrogenase (short-subunit alcohol dehydrogenase family)
MADATPSPQGGRLAGRRVIVTGAASGIARAIAQLFAREGASLMLLDRDASGLASVADELQARSMTFDLEQTDGLADVVDRTAEELGGLDGMVNCAALAVAAPIEATDAPLLGRFVAVNLVAPYLLCRAALPYLRQAEVATIVNIASGLGLHPSVPNNTAYAATKGGLIAFTKALAAEAAPRVRANAVCPGITLTPGTQEFLGGYENASSSPFVQHYALKRVADPLEIAAGALFLTSSESSFVTGAALAVDGGRTFH